MPTKKTTTTDKKVTKKVAAKTTDKAVVKKDASLRDLRADLYVLKMKHALRELKETHKIKIARKAVARLLTSINNV